MIKYAFFTACPALCFGLSAMGAAPEGWPAEVKELSYLSTADNTRQPALVFSPDGLMGKAPLLVALHTWSYDYKQTGGETVYAKWCIQNGWHFIHPNFRGPNSRPEALGSELAVEDIVSAVDYMKTAYQVDADRIYLVGVSGGGHASLLMAGRRPDIWAGVSAWCGISDVKRWHSENKEARPPRGYYKNIESACGGDPSSDANVAAECAKRSPLTYLKGAKGLNLDINAGVHDGRKGSVPFSQSLYAFNEVANEGDVIPPAAIEAYYASMRFPEQGKDVLDDILYGKRRPLFRKVSGNARVTIFDGGHDIVHLAALNWLAQQRKGAPAVWRVSNPVAIKDGPDASESGK